MNEKTIEQQVNELLERAEQIKKDLSLSKNVRNSQLTALWSRLTGLQAKERELYGLG